MTTEYTIEGKNPLSIRDLIAKHPFLGSRVTYSWKVIERYFRDSIGIEATPENINRYLSLFGPIRLLRTTYFGKESITDDAENPLVSFE